MQKKKSTAYYNGNSENSYRRKLQVISDGNTWELLLEGFVFLLQIKKF